VALAYDPEVRRTGREYLAGRMSFDLVRNMSIDDITATWVEQPDDKTLQLDLPNDRRTPKLEPGTQDSCSRLHSWIMRSVGVHGRATEIDGFGAQFVVPGFVAVDLAQPVLGAALGQPRRGIEGPNVNRVPRHVSRRVGGGDPSGSFRF
jgi:hypothetical protein